MGKALSSLRNSPALQRAENRLSKLWNSAYWFCSNTTWIVVTAGICLIAPVIFFYEKECQMFEMQQQFMDAQQAAAQAQQIASMGAAA